MNLKNLCFFFCAILFAQSCPAAELSTIRLGVMASGTLAWELAAIKNENLLQSTDFSLENINLANQQAGKVALQSGNVDMIISDWIWVSSMRAEGVEYSFYPYSNTSGGLLAPADSDIKTLKDLNAKKLGIAGGELDKNWLLLQALGLKQGIDLNHSVEKVYAAPPLLNQQLYEKRIDALLTYWQFAAKLEAQGYRQSSPRRPTILTSSFPTLKTWSTRAKWTRPMKSSARSRNSIRPTSMAGAASPLQRQEPATPMSPYTRWLCAPATCLKMLRPSSFGPRLMTLWPESPGRCLLPPLP